jgi:hypothetical protein
MTLEVIGTGFGRTGTDSMREALTILGFGPCHHQREVIEHPETRAHWRAIACGATPDWDLLLGGYRSCVDWPSAHYWPQLIEAFPEAKVLPTWGRRSPPASMPTTGPTTTPAAGGTTTRRHRSSRNNRFLYNH